MITVVIASYKYGHLAAHCIDSVISQTRKPDKIIFVDDTGYGAGDCEHLPGLYPEVEFIFRWENMGTVANFQDMLSRITTERYLIVGADNWLRLDALEKLSQSSADIVSYDIALVGTEREKFAAKCGAKKSEDGTYYWSRKGGHHGSMLFNTKKAQAVGYEALGKAATLEDEYLFNHMKREGATYEHIPEAMLYYRRHKENFNKI